MERFPLKSFVLYVLLSLLLDGSNLGSYVLQVVGNTDIHKKMVVDV